MPEKIRFDGDVITSRQNRRVVELMKLDDRRAREKSRLFRFDGVKMLCEALRRRVELDQDDEDRYMLLPKRKGCKGLVFLAVLELIAILAILGWWLQWLV